MRGIEKQNDASHKVLLVVSHCSRSSCGFLSIYLFIDYPRNFKDAQVFTAMNLALEAIILVVVHHQRLAGGCLCWLH